MHIIRACARETHAEIEKVIKQLPFLFSDGFKHSLLFLEDEALLTTQSYRVTKGNGINLKIAMQTCSQVK